MKQFNRLPRWLRVLLPAALVSICVAINAIALTEIVESIQTRSAAIKARPQLAEPAGSSTAPESTAASPTDRSFDAFPEISSGVASGAYSGALPPAVRELSKDKATPKTTVSATDSPAIEASGTTVSTDVSTAGSPSGTALTIDDAAIDTAAAKYGHKPYDEGETAAMVPVASYAEGESQRVEMLHPDAAKALFDLVAAARVDGVWIVPASGYRTIAQQRTIFNAQIAKTGSPEAAAVVSAPPGYSEHHTGYAVDLADGSLPQNQDISDSFGETEAYRWLLTNAPSHGFELSFPENNPQGISFEPWHWRYVGTDTAQVVFGQKQPSVDTRNATNDIVE
ncbi:MAG: M15 family metallopeptidase [Cyanobacteria bacterium J06614_10]